MFAAIEDEIVAAIKASPLAAKLRAVDSLPSADEENLLARFSADSPAVYVTIGGFVATNRILTLRYGLACCARNARGHHAARDGDALSIGAYEMMGALVALFAERATANVGWHVTGGNWLNDKRITRQGLTVCVVNIEGRAHAPDAIDMTTLNAFTTYHAEHSLAPGADEPQAIDEVTLPQ